jgi:hypothetical protein
MELHKIQYLLLIKNASCECRYSQRCKECDVSKQPASFLPMSYWACSLQLGKGQLANLPSDETLIARNAHL